MPSAPASSPPRSWNTSRATVEVYDSYVQNTPLPRLGEPEDVAQLARFLIGPESSWITGQVIDVDGGHSLRRGPDFGPFGCP